MKKIRKSHIFAFLLGAVLFGFIGAVSATILYQADEIGFTPDNPNWNVNNLEDALNDLYANRSGQFGNIQFLDGLMTEDSATLNLSYTSTFDGKILVVATNVQGKSNPTVVNLNNQSVNMIDTNSYPNDNYRKIKYAVIDVEENDVITCTTNSQGGDSSKLIWSYSSCSFYGLN